MPVPYLIKLHKKDNVPMDTLENIWSKAKDVINKEYNKMDDEQFYALVTSVFLKIYNAKFKKPLKEDGVVVAPGASAAPVNTTSTMFGLDSGVDTRYKKPVLNTSARGGDIKKPTKWVPKYKSGNSKMIPSIKKMME